MGEGEGARTSSVANSRLGERAQQERETSPMYMFSPGKSFVSKRLWVNNIILVITWTVERHINYGLPSANNQGKPEPQLDS